LLLIFLNDKGANILYSVGGYNFSISSNGTTGLFSKVYTSVPNTLGMVRVNGRKIKLPLPVARNFNVPLTVPRNDDYYSD
jgi:hypothetical protein